MEIASLTEHLLTECERRADFTQCPLCSEALTRDKLTEHAQSTACNRESLCGCTVFFSMLIQKEQGGDEESFINVTY